jgi:hypothetical protein
MEGKTKTFYYKQKLDEFMTTEPVLQKIHKTILHTEEEDKQNMRMWERKIISPEE